MRFDSASNRPAATSAGRWILWAATLVPALIVLSCSLRSAGTWPKDAAFAGRSPDEAQRLRQIMSEPRDASDAPLPSESVRIKPATQAASTGDALQQPATDSEGEAPLRIDESLLAAIADNTFGVPQAEKPAFDAVLAKVRAVPQPLLERAAIKDVSFAELMLDADRFRGPLLSVVGDVRRLNPIPPAPADSENRPVFEAWLFTNDSGLHPYRVLCTQLPEGLSFGDEFNPPPRVRVAGYFFKRYSFATAADFHTAPLLIARTLTLLAVPRSAADNSTPHKSRTLTRIAVAVLAAFALTGIVAVASWRRRSNHDVDQFVAAPIGQGV